MLREKSHRNGEPREKTTWLHKETLYTYSFQARFQYACSLIRKDDRQEMEDLVAHFLDAFTKHRPDIGKKSVNSLEPKLEHNQPGYTQNPQGLTTSLN